MEQLTAIANLVTERKIQLKSQHILTLMHQRAMDRKFLPYTFEATIQLMVTRGIHPGIFKKCKWLRKIAICPALLDSDFGGAYFGKLEPTFPDDLTDWEAMGWDGKDNFIMHAVEQPSEWVILHEFGHYLDDVFFSSSHRDLLSRNCSPSKIMEFHRLHQKMHNEFDVLHQEAKDSLTTEQKSIMRWYNCISSVFCNYAPSRYALVTFNEWKAEGFRMYYQHSSLLKERCLPTFEFLDFALQGQLFPPGS